MPPHTQSSVGPNRFAFFGTKLVDFSPVSDIKLFQGLSSTVAEIKRVMKKSVYVGNAWNLPRALHRYPPAARSAQMRVCDVGRKNRLGGNRATPVHPRGRKYAPARAGNELHVVGEAIEQVHAPVSSSADRNDIPRYGTKLRYWEFEQLITTRG